MGRDYKFPDGPGKYDFTSSPFAARLAPKCHTLGTSVVSGSFSVTPSQKYAIPAL